MKNYLQMYSNRILICGTKIKLKGLCNSFECDLLFTQLIIEEYRDEILNFHPETFSKSKRFFVKLEKRGGIVKMKILNENHLLIVEFKALDNYADTFNFYRIVLLISSASLIITLLLNYIK